MKFGKYILGSTIIGLFIYVFLFGSSISTNASSKTINILATGVFSSSTPWPMIPGQYINIENEDTADHLVSIYHEAEASPFKATTLPAKMASASPAALKYTFKSSDPVGQYSYVLDTNVSTGTFSFAIASSTASASATGSATATATPTITPTASPSMSPSTTPSVTPTSSPTSTPTVSPNPTVVPSVTPTSTPSPTIVPTVSPTLSPTAIPTAIPTASPTPVATASPTLVPTGSPTATPTVSPTPTLTPSPTVAPTATPIPTASPTSSPSQVPSPTPTIAPSPTVVPTVSPTPTLTPSPTTSPTQSPVPSATPNPTGSSTPTPGGQVLPAFSIFRPTTCSTSIDLNGKLLTEKLSPIFLKQGVWTIESNNNINGLINVGARLNSIRTVNLLFGGNPFFGADKTVLTNEFQTFKGLTLNDVLVTAKTSWCSR